MPNLLTKSNPTSELQLPTHEIIAPSYPPTGEFYSPDSALYADSYSVSVRSRETVVANKRPRLFSQKYRVAGYI